MDLKQIKQIIDLMKRSELTEFAVEEEGFKLKIKRGENGVPIVTSSKGTASPFVPAQESATNGTNPATPAVKPATAAATSAPAPVTSLVATPAADEAGVTYIKSPMVGTFYRSSSPESGAFVEVGSKVSENTVVCIIEAMKIMNEIQAEAKGAIIEVLVESVQPVEYGQRLFKVKAA